MRAIGSSLRCWAGLTLAPLCLLASPVERYGQLPLSFEPNQGQAPSGVQFLARGPGYLVGLSAGSSTLVLGSSRAVVRANLIGANASASGAGQDPLPGKAQYFIGNSPDGWRSGIPTFGRVRFREVYPGVDLVYYGTQRQLEYDFEVSPGADPGRIRISFDGVEKLRIASNGDLVLGLREGELRHHRPRAYQRGSGGSRPVNARYRIAGRGEVSIELADYDHSRALTIDPVLTYSTYLGGTGDDRAYGIAVDAAGCAYIVGETFSNNFPAANAWQPWLKGYSDVFVTKLNAAGTALVFSTYIGGSDRDAGSAIALDASGNIYIAGYTRSTNFPATYGVLRNTSAGGEDAFVAKLGPDGSYLAYSTYLGGSGNDRAQAIAVDASGNAYIAGYTGSVNFPLVSAVQNVYGGGTDGFVAKLNPYASGLVYSTYLGGSDNDTAAGIAVDSSGAAYITGQTQSANFPARNALQPGKAGGADAFVTKLTPAGNDFVFSTYLGGSGTDGATAIALDSAANVHVTGNTFSIDFPVTAGRYQAANSGGYDAFVVKMTPSGGSLLFSTYLGGSGTEDARGIAVDRRGNVYVTGGTESTNFPLNKPFQPSFRGGRDAFLAELGPSGGSLVFSTYLGGSGYDQGWAVAVDSANAPYLTGYSFSTDFLTAGPYQGTLSGVADAILLKLTPDTIQPSKAWLFRSGDWLIDRNGNWIWNGPQGGDVEAWFGLTGDAPVVGDWTGSGLFRIGVFRSGTWLLDSNGNWGWDDAGDRVCWFGLPGDLPVVGDWDGSKKSKIGVFRNGTWLVDYNGNCVWDDTGGGDRVAWFGLPGDVPVAGDWDGSGRSKIGVFRNGQWLLDYNGNWRWDGENNGELVAWFGLSGDIPVVGDWDGSGKSKIGVFRNGQWYLDYNGNFRWDDISGGDRIISFGLPGDKAGTGSW